jgi:hypothetical protein
MSDVELCADDLRDALLDEADQFGFDVMAGELRARSGGRSR